MEPTIHWFRLVVVNYITTGASGNSFGPAPGAGKCVANSRDTASIPLITPPTKFPALNCVSMSTIFFQPAWPTLASMPRSATISKSWSASSR